MRITSPPGASADTSSNLVVGAGASAETSANIASWALGAFASANTSANVAVGAGASADTSANIATWVGGNFASAGTSATLVPLFASAGTSANLVPLFASAGTSANLASAATSANLVAVLASAGTSANVASWATGAFASAGTSANVSVNIWTNAVTAFASANTSANIGSNFASAGTSANLASAGTSANLSATIWTNAVAAFASANTSANIPVGGGWGASRLYVRNEQTVSDTTPVTASGLSFALTNTNYYHFQYNLLMRSGTAGTGPRVTLTIPAATQFAAKAEGPIAADGAAAQMHGQITAGSDAVIFTSAPGAASASTVFFYKIEGNIVAGADGALAVLFANETGTAPVRIVQGSNGILWNLTSA